LLHQIRHGQVRHANAHRSRVRSVLSILSPCTGISYNPSPISPGIKSDIGCYKAASTVSPKAAAGLLSGVPNEVFHYQTSLSPCMHFLVGQRELRCPRKGNWSRLQGAKIQLSTIILHLWRPSQWVMPPRIWYVTNSHPIEG
jgi:hypothetical protein